MVCSPPTHLVVVLASVLVSCSALSDDGPDDRSNNAPEHLCESSAEAGRDVIASRCLECHSVDLTGADRQAAPEGSDFDTDGDVRQWAERIRVRAIEQRNMPASDPLDDCEATALDALLTDVTSGPCEPRCDGRDCGSDGCGGSCGDCGDGELCQTDSGLCVAEDCTPNCAGVQCGPDGCGGVCGTCEAPESCTDAGQCTCVADCDGKVCGTDGCGGSCGSCTLDDVCDGGMCACVPDCDAKMCGPDGCGGSCGDCTAPQVCNTRMGTCADNCTPDCDGRICGDDGCGGSCGTCDAGETCLSDGTCACVPDCVGKVCGGDGCGGSCGDCDANETCTSGACECVPDCSGKSCGGDGCGGSCGTCLSGGTCNAGVCEYGDVSFADDLMPIFDQHGCGTNNCHGGVMPRENLDMSSTQVAYDDMVGQPAEQCNDRLLVEAGSPSTSYLIDKVVGSDLCFGSRMPKSGSGLSDSEIDLIRIWILDGAPNN